MRMVRPLMMLVAALAVAAGCSKSDPAPSGGNAAANAAPAAAKEVFAQRCATCHGADGKGTGVAAAALNPKPRDYTDGAWQASVTDEQIRKAILGGGPAIGKSATMPPNPDLEAKPEIVKGLVTIIRAFKR